MSATLALIYRTMRSDRLFVTDRFRSARVTLLPLASPGQTDGVPGSRRLLELWAESEMQETQNCSLTLQGGAGGVGGCCTPPYRSATLS